MRGLYLEFTWHYELWSVHTDEGVHAAEEKDGQDDRKVTDELPHLEGGNIYSRFDRVCFLSLWQYELLALVTFFFMRLSKNYTLLNCMFVIKQTQTDITLLSVYFCYCKYSVQLYLSKHSW